MAINFPSSPANNQIYSENGLSYKFSSTANAWLSIIPVIADVTTLQNGQVVYANNASAEGSYGLYFDATANTIYTNNVSVTLNVSAAYFKGNGSFLTGVASDLTPAFNQANLAIDIADAAYDKANAANVLAFNTGVGANTVGSAAFAKANGAAQLAFVTVAANGTNLVADSNNDTLTLATSGNVSIIGNATNDTATFDLTNTGVVAATYGNTSVIPVIVVDAKGRITGITNVAIAVSSGGYFQGNNGDISPQNFGDIFRTHSNTFTGNVTIASGNNSIAAGPINIATGAKLTIQDGARVSIV